MDSGGIILKFGAIILGLSLTEIVFRLVLIESHFEIQDLGFTSAQYDILDLILLNE